MKNKYNRKVWIDLENSPHVPFFKPIMDTLNKNNYSLVVTARNCFQVCGLADLSGIKYTCVGRHYGKNKVFKVVGLLIRALQMMPIILRARPDVAVSHGSRTQMLVAAILRIPSISIIDYEHARRMLLAHPNWVLVPDVISDDALPTKTSRVLKYPGIKEDVYVPDFRPDPSIRGVLGLAENDVVATIRPPASEAHYRSPMSERLFTASVETLAAREEVRMVMLPRNEDQAVRIRAQWPALFTSGKIIIPKDVVDGLNLIWHSDLVISGGGTMNREAAALRVPVYSIFCGKTGAVDQFLANEGRLTLLKTEEDVKTKLMSARRDRGGLLCAGGSAALKKIVSVIEEAAGNNGC